MRDRAPTRGALHHPDVVAASNLCITQREQDPRAALNAMDLTAAAVRKGRRRRPWR